MNTGEPLRGYRPTRLLNGPRSRESGETAVRTAGERDRTRAPVHDLNREPANPGDPVSFVSLVGNSPGFGAATQLAWQCAKGSDHVLIEGESGTGKDTFARAIHLASPRSRTPLEIIRVAGASEDTLGSRLFGHVRGAFVGAFEEQAGLLQRYAGATLLLDHVDCLPIPIQQRLGQALHERRARPIGGTRYYSVDVRIVALSCEKLPRLVKKGAFDARLFDVLARTRIELPPIRERGNDTELLAHHFLRTMPSSESPVPLTLDESAIELLRRSNWPGNIPQLQEALLRAASRTRDGVIGAKHFDDGVIPYGRSDNETTNPTPNGSKGVPLFTAQGEVRPLADIEADMIRLAIKHYEGRLSEVARRLGIGRSTLYRKMANLGDKEST